MSLTLNKITAENVDFQSSIFIGSSMRKSTNTLLAQPHIERITKHSIQSLPLPLQVKHLLNAIDQTRAYSTVDEADNADIWIRSTKHKKNVVSDCRNLVVWKLEQNPIATIESLNNDDYVQYLKYVESKGVSIGHLINIESSLLVLEGAMKLLKVGQPFCPSERLYTSNGKLSVSNRAYTDDEINALRKYTSAEACKAIDLMLNLGLIVKEAVNVRAEHFVISEKGLALCILDGSGVSRGGCSRFINVPIEFEQELVYMLQDKEGFDKLVDMKESGVRNAINKACLRANISNGRGCNGFRHAYARKRINALLNEKEAVMLDMILSKMQDVIGTNSNGKQQRIDKGFNGERQKIFKSLREKLMVVLGELGCNNYKTMWHMILRYYC